MFNHVNTPSLRIVLKHKPEYGCLPLNLWPLNLYNIVAKQRCLHARPNEYYLSTPISI